MYREYFIFCIWYHLIHIPFWHTATIHYRQHSHVNNLFEWFCANRLSLNANKTKYVVIRPHQKRCNLTGLNIHIDNISLTRIGNDCEERATKFLGMFIDEHLTWKSHMEISSASSSTQFSQEWARRKVVVKHSIKSNQITWKSRISHVNAKVSRSLFAVNQVKNILPKSCLRTLYFSLIHPHFSYGLLAWGSASLTALKSSIMLQKRANTQHQ